MQNVPHFAQNASKLCPLGLKNFTFGVILYRSTVFSRPKL